MIHATGTGDKSETTFYTVPELPSLKIENAGISNQTYTWALDFRLCRMPEDLLS